MGAEVGGGGSCVSATCCGDMRCTGCCRRGAGWDFISGVSLPWWEAQCGDSLGDGGQPLHDVVGDAVHEYAYPGGSVGLLAAL